MAAQEALEVRQLAEVQEFLSRRQLGHHVSGEDVLVASHMEAINHCILSRVDLRAFSEREGFGASLLIPADGESVTI